MSREDTNISSIKKISEDEYADVTVIGAGPIGLFAAFQAGILGLKCNVIETLSFVGGQCQALYPKKILQNIPGHFNIKAKDLIVELYKQAEQFNPRYYLTTTAKNLEICNKGFKIKTDKNIINTKTIVLATGKGIFSYNKPQIKDIDQYENKSIYYSITNPKIFHQKTIVIIGGGDSALDWTINLSSIVQKIYLVHRREEFKCSSGILIKLQELIKLGIVELVAPYQLKNIIGKNGQIEAIIVQNALGHEKTIIASALLPFFGLKTEIGPIQNLAINLRQGYIAVDNVTYETSIMGIYAIGDAIDYKGKLRLLSIGFAEAVVGMHNVYKYIYSENSKFIQYFN